MVALETYMSSPKNTRKNSPQRQNRSKNTATPKKHPAEPATTPQLPLTSPESVLPPPPPAFIPAAAPFRPPVCSSRGSYRPLLLRFRSAAYPHCLARHFIALDNFLGGGSAPHPRTHITPALVLRFFVGGRFFYCHWQAPVLGVNGGCSGHRPLLASSPAGSPVTAAFLQGSQLLRQCGGALGTVQTRNAPGVAAPPSGRASRRAPPSSTRPMGQSARGDLLGGS